VAFLPEIVAEKKGAQRALTTVTEKPFLKDAITIIGGGLAGCEAAWHLAQAGLRVQLIEMKPERHTPAQSSDDLAELVCSNSLRSTNPMNAVGLLKEEMVRLGSLIIACAHECRVPAGDALAVDRIAFSRAVTKQIRAHPRIRLVHAEVAALPQQGTAIIATGPLTSAPFADEILRVSGDRGLYFYDAIAPIVSAQSVDLNVVFAASRYGKGSGDDYLNCPLDKPMYQAFFEALIAAECVPLHPFEEPRFFTGCQPIEVIAQTGPDALRFGPMKPVGLTDPHTGRRPFAVVQLRKEDRAGEALNLVGFQTKMTHAAQKSVLRMIPGLSQAEFLRFGAVHRNTYIDSPRLLDDCMRLKSAPHLLFAGQIAGVEGYVESAGHGLLTATLLAAELLDRPIAPPPPETALGALWSHVTGRVRMPGRPYEPQNVNWSLCPAPPPGIKRAETKRFRLRRAVTSIESWARENGISLMPSSFTP
jgi:methylenetetrahydrofolate--tRNA-(uracil-5-)-methyltransferase